MAAEGVMAADYAYRNPCVNSYRHWPTNGMPVHDSPMDYLAKNLAHLSTREGGPGPQTAAGRAAGVGQPAISKIITGKTQEPGYRTVMKLAAHFGVSVDDLLGRDLEAMGPSVPSQPAGLDVGKLTDLLDTVEAAIAQSRRQVPSRTKARMVAALYSDERASAAGSAEAVQAVLASILATMEDA